MNKQELILDEISEQEALRIAAADWLQRINNERVSDAEIQEWLAWYGQKDEHRRAFDRAELMFRKLRSAPAVYKDVIRRTSTLGISISAARKTARWTSWRRWAVAATVLVMVASAAAILFQVNGNRERIKHYQTARGENKSIQLPDGSTAVVGGQSQLEVEFNKSQRTLRVLAGEVYFQVKRDVSRPFVVTAGLASVTALGTAFDIHRSTDQVTVTVTDGAVEVERRATEVSKRDRVKVSAGERTVVAAVPAGDSNPKKLAISRVNRSAAVAWQKGHMSFTAEPLSAVIENVNRYSPRQVAIGDASVGKMTYTGTVLWTRTDEWIENLPQIFPLRAVTIKDGTVVLVAEPKK